MFQIKANLLYNKRVKHNYFHCALEAADIARVALPGQFVNVQLTETFDPLLRRPFSIHRVRNSAIEILYEVLGKGSQIFSQKRAGEYLDIIGPLGKGFPIIKTGQTGLWILAAGGMGVAPLMFLADRLVHRKVLILLGAKTKDQLLCEKEFKSLGCTCKIATDDGSKGFKGRVTDLLNNLVSSLPAGKAGIEYRACLPARQVSSIYACGPKPMLKEIAVISKNYKIPAQISLEEHMACGIGACLGCAVDTRQGFKRVCKDGPVFLADEIVW